MGRGGGRERAPLLVQVTGPSSTETRIEGLESRTWLSFGRYGSDFVVRQRGRDGVNVLRQTTLSENEFGAFHRALLLAAALAQRCYGPNAADWKLPPEKRLDEEELVVALDMAGEQAAAWSFTLKRPRAEVRLAVEGSTHTQPKVQVWLNDAYAEFFYRDVARALGMLVPRSRGRFSAAAA